MLLALPTLNENSTVCRNNERNRLLAGRSALVDYDPEQISLMDMKAEINGIGYNLIIDDGQSVEEIEKREYVLLRRKTIISWLFAIIGMAISMRWIDLGSARMTNQTAMLIALANLSVLRKTVLRERFQATQAPNGEHGHTCRPLNVYRFPFQCFQYVLGR